MEEIRVHGRGGQGSVTLAHLIAEAAYEEGKWAQAFPAFGVERRGAPVEAFARIGTERITDRSQVHHPTHVVVQDATLLEFVNVTEGLADDGVIVVNTPKEPEKVALDTDATVLTVGATEIAMEHLGRPIMNTALLGAFAGATDVLGRESIGSVISSTFEGEIGTMNVGAADAAFAEVSG